jgi:methionine synthase II (cobalamin-independent)
LFVFWNTAVKIVGERRLTILILGCLAITLNSEVVRTGYKEGAAEIVSRISKTESSLRSNKNWRGGPNEIGPGVYDIHPPRVPESSGIGTCC